MGMSPGCKLLVDDRHQAPIRRGSKRGYLYRKLVGEEAAARQSGIPFESHAREHAKIGAFVRAKIVEVSSGDCNIPALMVFMERCFETHMVHHDLKLGRQLLPAEALG